MKISELIALHKSNSATSMSVNQTLHPGAAKALVNDVLNQSQMLQEITTVMSDSLSHPAPVLTMSTQNLTRLVESGTGASESTKKAQSGNIGKDMLLKDVDLLYDLGYSVLDHSDGAEIEKMVKEQIAQTFSNDLLDLGTNGISDTQNDTYNAITNPVPMYTLAKGWCFIAKESALTNKVDTHSDTDLLASMDKMIKALPAKYRDKTKVKFILSPDDYEDFLALIAAKNGTGDIIQDGKPRGYHGYPVIENPFIEDGCHLLTNPKNLVIDINVNGVKKSIVNEPRRKCYEYTYTLPVDFEISVDPALVIAYDGTTDGWENSSGWYEA